MKPSNLNPRHTNSRKTSYSTDGWIADHPNAEIALCFHQCIHSEIIHVLMIRITPARPRSNLQPADAAALEESVGEDDESDLTSTRSDGRESAASFEDEDFGEDVEGRPGSYSEGKSMDGSDFGLEDGLSSCSVHEPDMPNRDARLCDIKKNDYTGNKTPLELSQLSGRRRIRDDEASTVSGEAERKKSRTALAHITGDDVDTSQGFIVYAAMAATTQDSPLKRLWHESEVPLPKRFKQAMKSP